jgi:cytochrome subunit of sulfide dehydrogenase
VRQVITFARAGAVALLVAAPVAAVADQDIAALADTCNNCHGVAGVSAGGSMASLAGQSQAYLEMVMLQWRTGERFSTTMGRLLAGYSEDEIKALAAHFAALPWTPAADQALDARQVRRGRFVAERCSKCHGDTGGTPNTAETPRLDGQWLTHLELELAKYRDGELDLPNQKMADNAHRLKDAEVESVSKFFASQTEAAPAASAP